MLSIIQQLDNLTLKNKDYGLFKSSKHLLYNFVILLNWDDLIRYDLLDLITERRLEKKSDF